MKISIPREAITEIMTSYNCSEEEAAKAYLDARDSADDAFNSFLEQRFDSQRQTVGHLDPKIYTLKKSKSI